MSSRASATTGTPSIPSTSTEKCRKDRGCFSPFRDLWTSWFPRTDDGIDFQCQGSDTHLQGALASETPNASSEITQVVQEGFPPSSSSLSSRSWENNEQGEQIQWGSVHGSTTCLTTPFERKVALHHTPQRKHCLCRAVEAVGLYMRKGIDTLSQPKAGQDEKTALSCNEYAVGPLRLINIIDSTRFSVTVMVEQEVERRNVQHEGEWQERECKEPPQWYRITKQWQVVTWKLCTCLAVRYRRR